MPSPTTVAASAAPVGSLPIAATYEASTFRPDTGSRRRYSSPA